MTANGETVKNAVALRVLVRFREVSQSELRSGLRAAHDLEYVLFTGDSPTNFDRFPTAGWLAGNCSDLADLLQAAAIPLNVAEEAANLLEQGVNAAAGLLGQAIDRSPDVGKSISLALRQEDVLQTRRMAITIVTNAFIFHENLAGSHGIHSVDELRNSLGLLTKTGILEEWRKIREINYYPIFKIAQDIVALLPQSDGAKICEQAALTAAQLVAAGVTRSHDLTGSVFQKLIADRKYLATFYTRPQTAALLAGLAVLTSAPQPTADWSNQEDVKNFSVADLACGPVLCCLLPISVSTRCMSAQVATAKQFMPI